MNLCRQVAHGAREEIDSDEAEGALPHTAEHVDIRALHEPRVRVEA